MQYLELLAPARNADIGIAAIDCGADAVYIGAPEFGARKDAGNSIEDISRLCGYAHRFGARVFVTFNTLLRPGEADAVRSMMLEAQAAGADAFIVRDPAIFGFDGINVPLHASTQCAIQDPEHAKMYAGAGCSRIVLERQLSLEDIREIASAVDCELEFFVHGALCVCYSGECRLSEFLDGRSADRGECIQACRSLYDLIDEEGHVLARNKALLSLRDFNLINRLEELADAGVCSFKVEGRLKNISYVRNVVRAYDQALNDLVAAHPDRWCRASFGSPGAAFIPDLNKTFNRGYTELYIDGKRGKWASMDAPKSMGEHIGRVLRTKTLSGGNMLLELKFSKPGTVLSNGDGFAFTLPDGRGGVKGFRGDVCDGPRVQCKAVPGLAAGCSIYRNLDRKYEDAMEAAAGKRELSVRLDLNIHGRYVMELHAASEDGRELVSTFNADLEKAQNSGRMMEMLRGQLSKRSGHYSFTVGDINVSTPGGSLPLLSAATINSMRRMVASDLDALPCGTRPMMDRARPADAAERLKGAESYAHDPLMLSRYCVRYELGMCPRHQGAPSSGELYLLNNGRKLELAFDCAACRMSVRSAEKSQ